MATKNSLKPFNSVRCVNALCALPSILRCYLPHEDRLALKIINLVKETRNSGVIAMLPHGASQQVPDPGRPPRNFTPIS